MAIKLGGDAGRGEGGYTIKGNRSIQGLSHKYCYISYNKYTSHENIKKIMLFFIKFE